jgi:4,5-dihydroxyphthalate decarboxylase
MLSEGILHGALVPGDSGYLGLFGGGETPKMMSAYPGVKPLFDNADEIISHTKKTGINPIIHILAMKSEIAEKYPDFPSKLTRAFKRARALASDYMAPDEIEGYRKEADVLGEDPYAYTMGPAERRTLQALNRYQLEQGLMREELPVDDIVIGLDA